MPQISLYHYLFSSSLAHDFQFEVTRLKEHHVTLMVSISKQKETRTHLWGKRDIMKKASAMKRKKPQSKISTDKRRLITSVHKMSFLKRMRKKIGLFAHPQLYV